MTYLDIYRRWREKITSVVSFDDLTIVRYDHEGLWVACPCGESDHVGWIPRVDYVDNEGRSYGRILTCFVTRKQWFVRYPGPPDIAAVVQQEEKDYFDLLKRAPAVIKKVLKKRDWSPATIAYLRDTHGIDEDVAMTIMERTEK